VKVPLILAGSTDTVIDLYYGNPAAAPGARPTEVWSNGFAAVYHLNGDVLDSDDSANHGINSGSTPGTGVVAGGRWFDFASVDSVEVGDNGLPTGSAARTLCSWTQTPSVATTAKHWFISYGLFTTNGGFFIGRVQDELWCGGVGNDIIANNVFTIDTWQYMCCTHDGTNADLYVDGVHVQGPANKSVWDVQLDRAFIGNHINSGESWDGGMDEARISSVARSPDWLAAEHASMTGTLVTIGAADSFE